MSPIYWDEYKFLRIPQSFDIIRLAVGCGHLVPAPSWSNFVPGLYIKV